MEERLERGLRRRRLASCSAKLGGNASADQGGEKTGFLFGLFENVSASWVIVRVRTVKIMGLAGRMLMVQFGEGATVGRSNGAWPTPLDFDIESSPDSRTLLQRNDPLLIHRFCSREMCGNFADVNRLSSNKFSSSHA